ncbi:hypothetical protein L2750_14435 [Shewanella submarina]|uniref:Uncharacterized protein n=1 Tax=Shewanella submarina TaxID=2016376 RepID=A0ABV7G536_9GAMM|nr:hypothetical protein [Shewanella submarina]MCL1038328.1 hypothetical protein [Shewanella submarina]
MLDPSYLRDSQASVFAQEADKKAWAALLSEFVTSVDGRRQNAAMARIEPDKIADMILMLNGELNKRGLSMDGIKQRRTAIANIKNRIRTELQMEPSDFVSACLKLG